MSSGHPYSADRSGAKMWEHEVRNNPWVLSKNKTTHPTNFHSKQPDRAPFECPTPQKKGVPLMNTKKITPSHPEQSRLDQQFDFIREIDKEKFIGRQTYLTGAARKENDAEHAWHMALMTILLSEYSNEPIDVLKTVTMLLIHDIVEIDAGDTYAYDEAAKATQSEREEKAAERIFGLLPKDQGQRLRKLWEEFEERKTPEARFARTMDNVQPIMLNAATDGKAWEEHQVKLSQILKRNERTAEGSEELWDYSRKNFIEPNLKKGRIIADREL